MPEKKTPENLYKLVEPVFRQHFVHYEEVLDVLCTGYAGYQEGNEFGSNIVLYGRGGFGKTEMTKRFAETVLANELNEIFVQSLGASSSDEAIWGELDLRSLREGDQVLFNLKKSFINHLYVILEEALDLPGRILDDMKDTISARCFRRGKIVFPMRTRSIVICTNKDLEELRSKNDSTEAFLSRFPLDLKVEWPDYNTNSYLKMYERQFPKFVDYAPVFAQIASGLSENALPVSPREARYMLTDVLSRARSRGRNFIVKDDFSILKKKGRFRADEDKLENLVESSMRTCGSRIQLGGLRWKATELIERLENTQDPGEILSFSTELQEVADEIRELKIPAKDGGFESVNDLKKQITVALRPSKRGEK